MMKLLKQISILLIVAVSYLPVISVQAQGIPNQPDYTILWSRYDFIVTSGDFIVGLSNLGVVIEEYDSQIEKYVQKSNAYFDFIPVSIKVTAEHIYIQTDNNEIILLSISSLPEINIVATISVPESFSDFHLDVERNNLYVSRWFDGLWQYHLDENYNPSFVDSTMKGILVTQIESSSDHIYLLDEYNGILRYQIDSMGALSFVDYLYIPLRATGFTIDDSIFAVTLNNKNILLGKFGLPGSGIFDSILTDFTVKKIFNSESLYIFTNERKLEVYDKSTSSSRYVQDISDYHLNGDFLSDNEFDYFLLANISSGISFFRLDSLLEPTTILNRNGPVTDFLVYDNNLFLGTGSGPVDRYYFDASGEPLYDTSIFSDVSGVNSFERLGDRLYVHYQAPNDVIVFNQINSGAPYIDSSITADSSGVRYIKLQENKFDNSHYLLLAVKTRTIDPYIVDDFGGIDFAGDTSFQSDKWVFDDFITSVNSIDSLLLVTTIDGFLTSYRIQENFELVQLDQIALPKREMTSLLVNEQLALFYGGEMVIFDYSNPKNLKKVIAHPLGMQIADAKLRNDSLFVAGYEGIGIFDMKSGFPIMMEFGGKGAGRIELFDNLIVASNSQTLDFYYFTTPSNQFVDVEPDSNEDFSLEQNFPNPFNATTTISYSLNKSASVEISVMNVLGQRVKLIEDDLMLTGEHSVEWDGTDQYGATVATGLYFYRVKINDNIITRKMLLLK